MSQLTRLSHVFIDEPLAPRPSVDDLWARSRRRHLRRRSVAAGLLALVVIGAFSIAKVHETSPTRSNAASPNVQLASYFLAAGAVPDATLETVGLPPNVAIPTTVIPSVSTVATNAMVSYVGAEYCPYCAMQRWALLVALSKFGSFTNLDNKVLSSSTDVFPHLASWSFVGATYKSAYFSFDPTEVTSSTPSSSGGYKPLEKMSEAQQRAFRKYDPQSELPFVDIGNHYITLGASSSPSALEGLTLGDIGSDLSNASSPVAQAVDGTANYMIAALCTMVQGSAPHVCSTRVSLSASKALDTGVSSTSGSPNSNAVPVQPPTNASMSEWKKWSDEMHAFLLAGAADFRSTNPGCTVSSVHVNGRRLTKPLFGVPAGVTDWSLTFTGKCGPKVNPR